MKLKFITLLLVLSSLFSTLPVYGTTYWARPNGTQDISGSTTFCNSIRSTDTNHTSVSRTNVPAAFGTIASAAACAQVAGDIVNISGIDGIYDSHDRRHTLKMDDVTVVPSFGLASGTSESNRTIVQGVPEDPVPEIRPDGGDGFYGNCCTLAALRNYITFQRLNINGINTSTTTNGVSCMGPIGSHVTLQDMEIQNCAYGTGIESFTNYTVYACNLNTDLVVRRNHIHHTGSTSGPSDPHGTGRGSGYAIYSYAQNMVIENNEFDHNTAEFLQIYDDNVSGGCDPQFTIIRNNYMHDLIPGHSPSFNAGKCGGAIALNGTDPLVYNNIVDGRCPSSSDPFGTTITFSAGITWGVAHCNVGSNGRGFVYNNLILGPGQAGTFGTSQGDCPFIPASGSEVKNNVVIGYGSILGGDTALVTASNNRLDALLSTCFNANFTIKAGSPCVNTGTTISRFTTDYVGTTRPQGSAWDLGPYELVAVSGTIRYVTPGGASGCTTPTATNYNPVSNSCGTGTSLVYSTLASVNPVIGAGNTVYLRAGTHNGTLMNHLFASQGTSGSRITIQAYSTGGVFESVTIAPTSSDRMALRIGDYVTYDHLTLDCINQQTINETADGQGAESCANTDGGTPTGVIFSNSTIKNARGSGMLLSGSFGAYSNLQIFNNGLVALDPGRTAGSGFGIYSHYITNTTFTNISVHDNTCGGLRIASNRLSETPSTDNVADRIVAYNNGAHAGTICGASVGILLGDDRNTVKNSIAYNNPNNTRGDPTAGFRIWASAGTTPTNNKFYNNTSYNNGAYGFWIETTSGTELINNISTNNPLANLIGSVAVNQTNRLTGNITDCTNSISDFHLKPGTPCVDSGTTLSSVTTDFDGTPRPQGGGYDIGAYELTGSRQFFVSPSGNNLNPCTPGSLTQAKLTPRAGAACLTQPGDKLTIKAGTYIGVEAHIYETLINVANGTAGNPTIIEGDGNFVGCAVTNGCLTKLRPGVSTQGSNLEDAQWIIIRGIEFDGTGNSSQDSCFRLGGTSSNVVFEDVHVHDCWGDGFSVHGPFNTTTNEPLSNTIRYTRVHSERNGYHDSTGCGASSCAQNHGFYVGATDVIIEDSIINNNGPVAPTGGGYGIGIQLYDSNDTPNNSTSNRGTIRRNKIYSNNSSGIAMDGTNNLVYDNEIYSNRQDGMDHGFGCPTGVKIYNNTITVNGGTGIAAGIFQLGSCTQQIDISNNIVVGNGTNINLNPSGFLWTNTGGNNAGPSGLSGGTVVITTVSACTVSTSDFRLNATSPCINTGRTSTLRPTFNGSSPDIGVYESFTCPTGIVTGNTITLTCDINVNTPLLPTSGVSGFSVNNGRTITNITMNSSTIQFTFDGAVCTGSETWTLTYAPGNVSDNAHIGYTTNQILAGFGPLTLINNCSPTKLYFVSPTGNDNDVGLSIGTAFATIQKCVSLMKPGDTCTVADGTYTSTTGIVVDLELGVTPGVVSGTVSSPITLKSTNKYGAQINISQTGVPSNVGIALLNLDNWIIDGFDITGGISTVGNIGITQHGGTGGVIRNNRIHDIATGVCSDTTSIFGGIFLLGSGTSGLIEKNIFHTIGRLRNGESGCTTTQFQNDHALIVSTGTNAYTIQNNLFYNNVKGESLYITGTATNVNVYNNTFADNIPTIAPLTSPAAPILLNTGISNITIKNNLNSNSVSGFISCVSGSTQTGMDLENNSTTQPFINVSPPCSFGSWTQLNNLQSSIAFVNAALRDYHLASGSQGIDNGQTISSVITDFDGVSRPQGSAYDRGAYEFVSTIIPRYVIPGSGSTGCINGGTNYNPTTNTCGTGTNTVYTSINNGWTWLQANPIGNTLIIRGGTYAETIAITSASGATSYAQAATVKAYSDPTTGIYEQVILQPGNIGSTAIIGFNCSCGNYLIFDHLILDGTGGYDGTSSSGASEGISMGQATSSIFTNLIHHVRFIDMEIRFIKGNGIAGRGSNNEIIRMYLHHNGIGAQIAGYQNGANGIYWATGNNNSIINSVFDNNLCYGVRFYYSPSDGSANNNTIDRSTFTNNGANKAVINGLTSTCGSSGGGTVLGNNGNTVKNSIFTNNNQAMSIGQGGAGSTSQFYYNNTAYNNFYGFYLSNAGNTGIVLQNNLLAGNTSKNIELNNLSVGITYTTNACPVGECGASTIPITAITDCVVSTSNLTLKAGTNPCRNAGTIITGVPFSENLPDIGAFESFTCVSGTITGNTVRVTCTAAFPPLLPSAPSGWSLNNGRTITNVSVSGNIVTLTMGGNICSIGEIWTATYVPGTMTDSILIGNTLNQPAFALGPISLTNNCTGTGDTTPPTAPTGVQIGRLTIYH